jgi:hypothetical protein
MYAVPINGEKFERGERIEHMSGAMYVYWGRLSRYSMWGVQTMAPDASFHIVGNSSNGVLYLEPDAIFQKNYREPGTWQEPEPGDTWHHKGTTSNIVIHKVIDDLVIYQPKDHPADIKLYSARQTDDFKEEFRHGIGR